MGKRGEYTRKFEENTLLRIRRNFSESEAVKFAMQENDNLRRKLSQCQIKSGEMKSEIQELEYQNEKLLRENKRLEGVVKYLETALETAKSAIPLSSNWNQIFKQADALEKILKRQKTNT